MFYKEEFCFNKKQIFLIGLFFTLIIVFIFGYLINNKKIIINNQAALPQATNLVPLVRNVEKDLIADIILGHKDFGEVIPKETVPFKLAGPGGVAVDKSTKPYRVYIFDGQNSRILGYKFLGYCSTDSKRSCSADSDCENITGQGRPTKIGYCKIDLGKDGKNHPIWLSAKSVFMINHLVIKMLLFKITLTKSRPVNQQFVV